MSALDMKTPPKYFETIRKSALLTVARELKKRFGDISINQIIEKLKK